MSSYFDLSVLARLEVLRSSPKPTRRQVNAFLRRSAKGKATALELAVIAYHDLYIFTRFVLGYDLLGVENRNWCEYIQQTDRPLQTVILEPRGSFKSTIFTIAYPIWRVLHDPKLTVVIMSKKETNCQSWLDSIKRHYAMKGGFRLLYGDWVSGKWGRDPQVEIAHRAGVVDPTYRTRGVGAGLASAHCGLFIGDDLVGDEDGDSAAARNSTKRAFHNIQALMKSTEQSEILLVGTHWHYKDLYTYIERDLSPTLADKKKWFFIKGSPYHPEGHPKAGALRFADIGIDHERLQELEKTMGGKYAPNMLQSPQLPGEREFFLDWLWYFDYQPPDDLVIIQAWDLAGTDNKNSDYTCVTTIGVDTKDGICYILDVHRQRLRSAVLIIEEMGRAAEKWNPYAVVIEMVGIQALFYTDARTYLNKLHGAGKLRQKPKVKGYKPTSSKVSRIRNLGGRFKHGQIVLPEEAPWLPTWIREYEEFGPKCDHDDQLDTLNMAFLYARMFLLPGEEAPTGESIE